MSNPVVLTEKLRRPEPAGLSRKRLEGPLLEGTTSRLHLVVAPPGSGKTTLLARVAAAATVSSPVAWYRVTGDDAAEPTHGRPPGPGTARHPGHRGNPNRRWPACWRRWRTGRATAPILILDDLHEIAGTAAERVAGAVRPTAAAQPCGC